MGRTTRQLQAAEQVTADYKHSKQVWAYRLAEARREKRAAIANVLAMRPQNK